MKEMFLIYEILVKAVLTKTKKNKSVLERGIIYMYIFPKGHKAISYTPYDLSMALVRLIYKASSMDGGMSYTENSHIGSIDQKIADQRYRTGLLYNFGGDYFCINKKGGTFCVPPLRTD